MEPEPKKMFCESNCYDTVFYICEHLLSYPSRCGKYDVGLHVRFGQCVKCEACMNQEAQHER